MMLEKLWDVAPPGSWAILSLAATLLLAGFVLLSHTLVRHKAYGDRYSGLTNPGRLEMTLRVGAACVLGGSALWALELGAPAWITGALGAAAVAGAALETVARVRS